MTDNSTQLDNLVALQHVVRALELRFPDHNGPFEYGTRLAEEAGELIEAAYTVKNAPPVGGQKQHLLKEMQDVLRVAYGIAGLYGLTDKLPTSLSKFSIADDPKDLVAYIAHIGIRSGELANAINHAEGMGVKKEKHGGKSIEHVHAKAYALAQVVAWMAAYFDAEAELEAQITAAYFDYKGMGFIA